MAYGEQTFTHRRLSRTGDGAGGKIESPETIGAVTGRSHFYQRESQKQMERTDQPARAVENEKVVIFDDPAFDIRQTDLLVEGDLTEAEEEEILAAVTWNVKHVRHYDFQTQADVELVA
jgi:hypothetical protein